jgi:hypothetical protein
MPIPSPLRNKRHITKPETDLFKLLSISRMKKIEIEVICNNPLMPELNPSAQRCLTRFFTGDFDS